MTTILASLIEEAHDRVAKANRKLAKAGIAERFELTVSDPFPVVISRPGEIDYTIFKAIVELNTPEIAYAGWTFVATLVDEDGDLITRTAPGQELGGWAPETAKCDQCGVNRYRSKTYIVRNASGELRQVGSSCIRLFLGVAPSALWALDYNLDDLESSDDDGFGPTGYGYADRAYGVRFLVRLAYVLTDGGKGYVSRAATEFGGTCTADEIFNIMSDRHPGETLSDRISREIMLDEAAKLPETVVDEVLASAATLDQATDYGRNLAILVAKDFVSSKSVGMVVSILTVFCKDRQRKAAKAEIASGFVGTVGQKLTNLAVTVQAVRYLDGYMPGSTSTLLVMRTADNHVVKWFASRKIEIDEGDKIVLKSATVKSNDVWQGQDQTALTRCRIA